MVKLSEIKNAAGGHTQKVIHDSVGLPIFPLRIPFEEVLHCKADDV